MLLRRRRTVPFAVAAAAAAAAAALAAVACHNDPSSVTPVNVPVAAAGSAAPLVIAKSSSSSPSPAESDDGGAIDPEGLISLKSVKQVVGSPAPGFSLLATTSRAPVQIRRGRVTLIHFWATWCGPCKQSLPGLDALRSKYQSVGLDAVGISVDDEEDGIAQFMTEVKVRVPTAWDSGHKLAERYHVDVMPTTYVIDRAGTIRFVHGGYHDGEEAILETELQQLF